MKGVLVDAEVARAMQRKSFGGLAAGELLIDTGDGDLSGLLLAGGDFWYGLHMVLLMDAFLEWLGAGLLTGSLVPRQWGLYFGLRPASGWAWMATLPHVPNL